MPNSNLLTILVVNFSFPIFIDNTIQNIRPIALTIFNFLSGNGGWESELFLQMIMITRLVFIKILKGDTRLKKSVKEYKKWFF